MILTNKKDLVVFVRRIGKNITIDQGEKLKFVQKKCVYNEYYGSHIYRIICDFNSDRVSVNCIQNKNSNDVFVNCVKESENLIKNYLWQEVFEEDFPE